MVMEKLIRENEFGLIECLSSDTGEVLWTQVPSKQKQVIIESGRTLKLKNTPDPRTLGGRPSDFHYSPLYARRVFDFICNGLTIKKIGKLPDMPPANTIYYWIKRYPDFKCMVKQAREFRKELILDRIVEIAELAMNGKNLDQLKLEADTLQWIYEKS